VRAAAVVIATAVIETVQSDAVLAGGGTIITATHRLARQIRWRHDQARAASGARAWPTADVLPLDAWLRRTWESITLRDSPLGSLRLLSDDESRLVWRRVLARESEDKLDAGVIVPLVAAGWRLCQGWGIPSMDLHAAADSEDGRAFAHWVDAYAGELERRAWLDSGGLLIALGQAGHEFRIGSDAWIGFAGFEPWTPALGNLANALREAGVTVVAIAPPRRVGPRQTVAARDQGDEFARACRWAADHANPEAGATVAIIIPNLERDADRARRIGLDVLAPGWQLREPRVRPVALAAGRQLADYPIVFCALTLLRLLATELTFDQASFLLRSCYVAGADQELAGRARAELKLRRLPLERVLLRTLLGLLGGDASQATAQAVGQWRRAESLAATVCSRRLLPSQWAGHFSAWLTAAGWPGDRGLSSEEYQAAEAWQRLLESFAGTDEVAGPLPLGTAQGLLAQQARDRPFEPESPAGAVQVLSLREAEGQDFEALWVCGLTADQWPPPARPHPLIPLLLQKAAGIPDGSLSALEAQTKRRFAQLLASADNLVLSWPAEQDETETLPSPLLASALLAESQSASTPEEETAPHPDRQRVAASAQSEVVPADPPSGWPTGKTVPGGARVLAMQAVCPARAFVEFRLGGGPLEAPARPLDLATRGKVVHRLLERLYSLQECSRGLGQIDTGVLRDLFAPLVSTVLDEFLPAGDPFLASLRPLESERLWVLLLSLRDLEVARSGFQVVTEVARQVRIGPLALSIRLDRLDRLEEGGELVIDYKTGRFAPAGWKRARLQESQLPLYAVTSRSRGVAVIQLRPPAAQLRGVGDDALGIPGIKSVAAFFREEDLAWNGTLLRWQVQLENLAGEFATGDFRVDPADRQWATGQFAGLTRIHELLPVADEVDSPDGAGE
jgi:probable DNA repair protein